MPDISRIKFSTDDNAAIHPIDVLRATMGRVDIDFPDEFRPRLAVEGTQFNGIAVNRYSSSPVRMSRRAKDFGREEINIIFSEGGNASYASGKTECLVSPGEAIFRDAREDGVAQAFDPARWKTLIIPTASLASRLKPGRTAALEKFAPGHPGGRLLHYYISAILPGGGVDISSCRDLVANHILDLAALMLGAGTDIPPPAENPSVLSVRLHAATAYIRAHLDDPDLSDESLARRFNLSGSYIRKMFVQEGGLQNFITRERLAMAHRLLTSGQEAKIIAVAFQCGFSSLYTFNRQFKRRFGYTPSEARDLRVR